MSEVDIRHVSKHYGTVAALDDVSLTLADGEFFGLLGPSGSGKTTLLRSIAGFVEPEAGQILIDGQDVSRISTHRRDIGMVFQNYALFPHMSVFDNVAFALSVRRVSQAETRARVAEMLALVQLTGYEERRPRQLSGGQQQRIALARALVSRPRVLLLDEPLGALDKNLRQQMQVELRQIQKEVGITTVLVTHDQEEALTLSDRIAIFREGQVVQTGKPDAVYERPRSRFAADFLGAANFLPGQVAGTGMVALADGQTIATEDQLPTTGQPVTLTVRPEKFTINAPNAEGQNRLSVQIIQPIYMGASITYRVKAGATELTVFHQNRDAQIHEPGTQVELTWSPAHTGVIEAG
ncbi:spermidine/putrescine ABC transporter ATP-binding subunit [Rhodoligotrophos appendicifer]|uniref:ABC transporter ATP-binding protein n=1 Tax=Rhodoligotrophos appendicifer TaxID=987056 RepID=UPI0011871F94|nr:ABC transporter ATP-binding protein [Rhodoligotrophos appendicifer]